MWKGTLIALLCELLLKVLYDQLWFSKFRHPERLIENTSICLILPDFDYKNANRHDPDVDKHARRWADILREKHGLTGKHITKVLSKIRGTLVNNCFRSALSFNCDESFWTRRKKPNL